MAADPFQPEALQERLTRAGGLALLIAFGGGLLFLALNKGARDERPIEGVVMRVGSYAHEVGDLPIVTVRLEDGSTRQLRARRAAVEGCEQGSNISLLQKGSHLRVGMQGCTMAH